MATVATESPLKATIGLKDAARRTGIPYSTLREYVKHGILRAYRVRGHRVYLHVEDLDRLFVPINPTSA